MHETQCEQQKLLSTPFLPKKNLPALHHLNNLIHNVTPPSKVTHTLVTPGNDAGRC